MIRRACKLPNAEVPHELLTARQLALRLPTTWGADVRSAACPPRGLDWLLPRDRHAPKFRHLHARKSWELGLPVSGRFAAIATMATHPDPGSRVRVSQAPILAALRSQSFNGQALLLLGRRV